MVLEDGRIRMIRGPRHNHHRPAVDPLFRSAALAYGPRVIGVVLSGNLDDGTAGLLAVKRRGGVVVVQDPEEAVFAGMPLSAVRTVEPDHVVHADAIGSLIVRLVGASVSGAAQPSDECLEAESSHDRGTPVNMDSIGTASHFTCPRCSGTLWEVDEDEMLRYRCRVGHSYSLESMLSTQDDSLEDSFVGRGSRIGRERGAQTHGRRSVARAQGSRPGHGPREKSGRA
jgi:two-component system chemotaxis response regulator CheB